MFFLLGCAVAAGTYVATFKDDFDKESLNAALGVVGVVVGVAVLVALLGSAA